MVKPPVTRATLIGKCVENLSSKLAETSLNFNKEAILECESIPDLKQASMFAIEARDQAENLVIGKISKLRRIANQDPMKIFKGLEPNSKDFQLHQILQMMGTDNDAVVLVDEDGSMAAVKIGEDGNLAIANKPGWVDSITLYRKILKNKVHSKLLKLFYL